MDLLIEFREWTMWLMEGGILYYVAKEFYYDKIKDDLKKQKRTKTIKKTTTDSQGSSVVEEQTEISEPISDKGEKGNAQ